MDRFQQIPSPGRLRPKQARMTLMKRLICVTAIIANAMLAVWMFGTAMSWGMRLGRRNHRGDSSMPRHCFFNLGSRVTSGSFNKYLVPENSTIRTFFTRAAAPVYNAPCD